MRRLKPSSFVAYVAVVAAWGCGGKDGPLLYSGESVAVGDGEAHMMVELDERMAPVRMGVRFTSQALEGLPDQATAFILTLPDGVAVPPFDHVSFDWQPDGHEPVGVWDVPHLDLHFFVVTLVERGDIEHGSAMDNPPGEEFVPEGYVTVAGSGEPTEGSHWVDPTSPEFGGEEFSTALVYGFYDAHLTFMEPMLALAFLEQRDAGERAVPQPDSWEEPGYYPLQWSFGFDVDTNAHEIWLEELVHHPLGG